MSKLPEYMFDRVFDAPLARVWALWTKPELLSRWYGPGVETIIHRYDLKPGGEWRNEMNWGGKADLSKMVFQDVVAEEKLVWLHSSADADWNVVSNPMMPNWPRVLLTTVTFTDMGEKTKVRLHQIPVDSTDEENACFAEMMAGMDKGWGSGFEIIAEMLAE